MDLSAIITYAMVASFTPGPNNIISMTHARNQGFRSTFPFISGVAAGCLLIMLMSSYFNLALYHYIPKITPVLNVFGCIYMLYLAFMIMKKNASTGRESKSEQRKHFSFWFGFTLQLINPKVILYGLTALSVFVLPHTQSHQQFLYYSLLLTLIGISANLSWALGGHLLQQFLLKYERPFHICMGLLLILTAFSLIK
ncbi:LysE family transporter [Paenibacillus barcinonensis]|uniref:LysE family transporter n=1 Tax=Paenibacillus barcinonensis TaxID=198119 RepID=A0A2V4VTQ1_PAEBA|nr:LysE family transporter [Paenibacillus barcinonensis]PYE50311.1 threonine/homoserine/homoserine lactone efflux protein [Paenibacillus barcinonensis]QKS54990.1 LysE family transporter [Paenibacillus barcinonensis]